VAIACLFEWPLVAPAQLKQLEDSLDWPRRLGAERWEYNSGPAGGMLIVIDVWESRAALELFLETCLAHMLIKAGLPQPSIKSWEIQEDQQGGYPLQFGGEDQIPGAGKPGDRSN
jgi:hypothetical protein